MANSKSKKSNNNVGAKIEIALLALLLVAIIVTATVLGVMSDGFKDWSFITGKHPEEEQPKLDVVLAEGATMIDVYNNTVAKISIVNGGKYTVKIQPKADAFFDFRLDGKLCAFSASSGDYNRVFNVSVDGDVVSFSSPYKTMLDVLNVAYFGHVVSDVPDLGTYEKAFFECVITAESGQSRTVDVFGIGSATVISIDPGKVVF